MDNNRKIESDIVWVNETQSEIYFSFYKHIPENPLANFKVKELNTLVTYNIDNTYGCCYSKHTKDYSIAEMLELEPFKNIWYNSFYTAMHAAKNADFKLGEISLLLQDDITAKTLLGDDLWLINTNEILNRQLIKYCFNGMEVKLQPFVIYMLNDESNALVETSYSTKCISDFILGNPQLFFEMPEDMLQ
jgi:hypothetical protein